MKRKVFLLLTFIVLCCSCSSNPLRTYKRNGQYKEITYDEFIEKVEQKEDFVFFIKQESCLSCSEYYPIVENVLASNIDNKIYSMEADDITPVNKMILLANITNTLGQDYLTANGYSTEQIYTPLTALIIDGEFEMMDIGVISEDKLQTYYDNNFIELKDYYDYSRRTAQNKSFVLFVSNEEGMEYKDSLKEYFKNNPDTRGLYLNQKNISETNKQRMINRINYFLTESISELPNEYVLTYKNGAITDYKAIKCFVSDLNAIYNK